MKNKYLSFLILFALLIISTKKNNAQIIPLTDGNIQEAVDLWFMHQSLAEDTYGPINQWDTSNVTDMSNLFSGRTFFNEPIGNWDVSNVTNMNSMFVGCDHFDQTLAFWNVSKVIDMGHMFKHTTFFNHIFCGLCGFA